MKTTSTILLLLVAVCVLAEEPKVEQVSIFTGTWLINFDPSGRAAASYGSNPGDSGYVDEGTVDFKKLLQAVTNTPRKTKESSDTFQVTIRHKGQTSTTAFVLVDDSAIRKVLEGLDHKWKPHPVGQRFYELTSKHPIVPRIEGNSEQPLSPTVDNTKSPQ
jgi:hypothetical protein